MAIQAERQLAIVDLIRTRKTVSTEELSKMFDISLNTVRRDLTVLEEQGVLKRTHSGAVLAEANQFVRPYGVRKSEYSEAKDLIGKAATALVREGDTIIIDAGTTTQQMVKYLLNFEQLTVLTNSLEIANEFLMNPKISVILSGGILRQESRSMIGFPAEQFFSQFNADKLFLSVGGISVEAGTITNPNIHETAVKKKMIEASREIIALADSHKLGVISLCPICPIKSINVLITDEKADQKMVDGVEDMGVEVRIAKHAET